jgi:hypothetical protein
MQELQGYVILAGMVAAAIAFAVFKSRRNTRRMSGAWGAAASVLTDPETQNEEHRTVLGGGYAGREVWAELTTTWASPGVQTSATHNTNYTVAMVADRGRATWSVRPAGDAWSVEASDPDVKEAIASSGILSELAIQPAPPPELSFDRAGTLKFHQLIVPVYHPGLAPTADDFRRQLDLLSRLADLNAKVNAPQ